MKKQSCFQSRRASAKATTLLLVALTGINTACAKSGAISSPAKVDPLIEHTKKSAGCANFEDEFYDGLYAIVRKGMPGVSDARTAFDAMLAREPRFANLNETSRNHVRDSFSELYTLLAIEGPQRFADAQGSSNYTLEAIASFEMGDRTTPAREEFMNRVTAKFSEIKTELKETESSCAKVEEQADPAPLSGLLGEWQRSRNAAVFGGLKVLATAYQSCEAGKRAALSNETEDAKGIKVFGTHPDGVGSKRSIYDLQQLISTHPYLSDYHQPNAACFNVRAKPPIYDYGGKPNTETTRLDLFKDAGTGTKVLGIDCSGYVYSSLATAGLKLKKTGRLKAVGVNGVRAAMWMDPQKNGLDCFDHAKFNGAQSLQPGDILASGGHVILIETVGDDPFGVAGISEASECRKENMSVSRFNFTLLQSAPVKGGIGINRIRGADYLGEGGSMADAMLEHAVNACLARTGSKSVTTHALKAGLVRHLGGKSCTDVGVKLAHEECVASCN